MRYVDGVDSRADAIYANGGEPDGQVGLLLCARSQRLHDLSERVWMTDEVQAWEASELSVSGHGWCAFVAGMGCV